MSSSSSSGSGLGFGTKVIHVGSEPDQITGAVAVPISLATTFAQQGPGVVAGKENPNSYGKGFEYSRTGNPTRGAFEQAVAAAEGAKYCAAFASGMAATVTILHMFQHGDHVAVIDDVYGGTQRYFRRIAAPNYGITFSFFTNPDELKKAIQPGKTKMVWLETPTNPTLKITDISACAAIAHEAGAILCVDNTFMSPRFQSPLALGADISMSSVTKYIGGHSDVVGGVVATNSDEIHAKLRFLQNSLGGVPSPFDCYLALRGLKTLHVRMDRHAQNAQAIAELLEGHAFVDRVLYPGLKSHPQHELACRQTGGHSGMVTFYIKGGMKGARTFVEKVQVRE